MVDVIDDCTLKSFDAVGGKKSRVASSSLRFIDVLMTLGVSTLVPSGTLN
jgi:hypothetical protein